MDADPDARSMGKEPQAVRMPRQQPTDKLRKLHRELTEDAARFGERGGAKAEELAAFMRPASKTPPEQFSSVEAAEAAGWTFDSSLGRWNEPPEQSQARRSRESRAKVLAGEAVDKMSVKELRDALRELTSEADVSKYGPFSSENLAHLQSKVKDVAAEVHRTERAVRKGHLSEAVSRQGGERAVGNTVCRGCGRAPGAAVTLKQCVGCKAVSYCSKECQKSDWKQHKPMCKNQKKIIETMAKSGEDPNKLPLVTSWYSSLLKVPLLVVRTAWERREESPVIKVMGGVNARLATVEVVPRSNWEQWSFEGLGPDLDYRARFDQGDFNRDVHYFLIIHAGHPGSEDWPIANMRMRFPVSPDEMHLWMEATANDADA